jgi:mannose PTS system EIIA component
MVGIVVVTHGKLAKELIEVVRFVLSSSPQVKMVGVCLDPQREFESFKQEIKSAIKKVKEKDGILLVTDMFGGTPSNISLTFLEENKVEVVSGVNLPMLLKLATLKDSVTLEEAVQTAESSGKENIIVASKLLHDRDS